MNLTCMRHGSAVTLHECAVRQPNAIVVQYEQTFMVPIYQLLSAARHCSITAFQLETNLTFVQHHKAVNIISAVVLCC